MRVSGWCSLVFSDLTYVDILGGWDVGWYGQIATEGYGGRKWAFFPLHPILMSFVAGMTGFSPAVSGAWVGTVIFLGFAVLLAKLYDRAPFELRPASLQAWLFFLLAPASFVFHTGHTEALFILLSWSAFLAAHQRRLVLSAVLAGLCALTRNQGVFVAIAVAYWIAFYETKSHNLYRSNTVRKIKHSQKIQRSQENPTQSECP